MINKIDYMEDLTTTFREMLLDDYAVYFNLKNQVQAILVRRCQQKRWTKMLDDEENCGYSVVTYWRMQLTALR